jgi:hypothetical protein
MPEGLRRRIKESLAVAALVGALTLLAALPAAFEDSRSAAIERSELAGATSTVVATSGVYDPDFRRVHSIRNAAGTSYGIVFSARSSEAAAIFGATFSPKGELRSLRILGASSSRLPDEPMGAIDAIEGAGETLGRAARAAAAVAEAGS